MYKSRWKTWNCSHTFKIAREICGSNYSLTTSKKYLSGDKILVLQVARDAFDFIIEETYNNKINQPEVFRKMDTLAFIT